MNTNKNNLYILVILLSIILVFVIAICCWLFFRSTNDSSINIHIGKSYEDISKEYYSVGAGSSITISEREIDMDSIEEVVDSVVDSLAVDSISYCDDASSYYSRNDHSHDYRKSSSKVFINEQYVTMYLVNQTFTNRSGIDIRIDGDCRIFIDGDYAGVIFVLRYTATSALIRYSGGKYGEGQIRVQISNNKLLLIDPLDGTTWYQK